MKNLELMGVQEMDAMEMRNENGGMIGIYYWAEMWGGANFIRLGDCMRMSGPATCA